MKLQKLSILLAAIGMISSAHGATYQLLGGFDGNQTADNGSSPKTLTGPVQHASAVDKFSMSLSTTGPLSNTGFQWNGMQSSEALWGSGTDTIEGPAGSTANTNSVYAHDAAIPTINMTISNTGTSNIILNALHMKIKRDGGNSPTGLLVTYLNGDLDVVDGTSFGYVTDENLLGGSVTKYDFALSSLLSDLTLGAGESANFSWESTLGDAEGQRARFDNIAISGTVAAVPEPSSVILLGLGLGCLLLLRRRR